MFYSSEYSSPVGRIFLASNGESLVGLWIEGQKYFCNTVTEDMTEKSGLPVFTASKKWLDRYFSGSNPPIFGLAITPCGTMFRKAVWNALCKIPYGKVTTYGNIAKVVAARINRPGMSAQAVGGAVGHNPVSIIIPCHRVVGSNGSLTGYAGGIDKKIKLLELEGVDMSGLFRPA
jgi:methylated-DNA-[protein]-cysteine S-methyltransferase